MTTSAAFIHQLREKSKTWHLLRWIHLANAILCIILTGLLIGVAVDIRSFISNGAALSGFGNYTTFTFPATYVYMLIPAVCALVYSIILFCDPSPSYPAWTPCKTFLGSIGCFSAALFLAALLPVLPGADIMTAPESAMTCTWRDYMSWRIIYNNPEAFPWVDKMDSACQQLRAADAMCWIVFIGWMATLVSYVQRARRAKIVRQDNNMVDEKTEDASGRIGS